MLLGLEDFGGVYGSQPRRDSSGRPGRTGTQAPQQSRSTTGASAADRGRRRHRRAPKTLPIRWCPRQMTRIGMRPESPRTTLVDISGSIGVQMTSGCGCKPISSATLATSFRDNLRCFTKLAETAGNVEDEGAVVVDDDNHNAPVPHETRQRSRCALASVSSYSAFGFDIAVLPLSA